MFERRWTITEKMNMKKLLTLILFVFSTSSFSSDWREFSQTNFDKFYIDKDSISKLDDNIFTYWILRSSLKEESIKSTKTKDIMNCKRREYRLTYMIQYSGIMGKGNIIKEGKISEDFSPVRPDTMEEDIYKFICKKKSLF